MASESTVVPPRFQAPSLILEGKRFREALGNDVIRSTDFEVRGDSRGFTFAGRGWGHGVGLSQWGAKEMADLAYQHKDILKFYYPLAEIRSLDGLPDPPPTAIGSSAVR